MSYNIPDPRFEMPELFDARRKPVGNVVIDWSHPLARGLVRYYPFYSVGGTGRELVSANPVVDSSGTGTTAITVNQYGEQVLFSTNGSVYDDVTTPVSGSENRTMLAEADFGAAATEYIFNISDGTGFGAGAARWTIRHDSGGSIRLEIQGGGYTSSLAISNGHRFVGCKLDGTQLQDHTLYVDGSSEAATGTTTIATSAAYKILVGALVVSSAPNDSTTWCALWNRALSDIEIESIRLNPYQFLIPA